MHTDTVDVMLNNYSYTQKNVRQARQLKKMFKNEGWKSRAKFIIKLAGQVSLPSVLFWNGESLKLPLISSHLLLDPDAMSRAVNSVNLTIRLVVS